MLAGGIVLLVVFWFGDRKRYAVMLAELAQQQERERQEAAKRAKMKSAKAAKESSPEALLEKLEALHKQGVLDDAEFEEKKAAILKKRTPGIRRSRLRKKTAMTATPRIRQINTARKA